VTGHLFASKWFWGIAAAALLSSAVVAPAVPAVSAAPSRAAGGSVHALTVKPGPQREVFGFVNAANLANPNVGYTTWNFRLLTTVAYFGFQVNSGDGNLVTLNNTAWDVYHSPTMTNLVNTAHVNGVRVILSLDLHGDSEVCSGLLAANTQNTIPQAITQMNLYGLDGINLNYEANNITCPNGLTTRDQMTTFVKAFRAAMPNGYLAVDSYAGSAEDNLEFFDVTGLAPYIDTFFVMSYDSDYSNSTEAPLNCTSYCFNPVSPLNTYRFNVSKTISQYTALVPASKVIIGQPYYGRRGCVPSLNVPYQYPIPNTNFVTTPYTYAATVSTQSGVFNFAAHRDPGDGVAEWDTWYDTDWGCNREQYFDDVVSLGAKYDLINRTGIAGVGLFTLDYGGGSPELWSLLATYFSCPVTIVLAAAQSTTAFNLNASAGACSVAYYDLRQYDDTMGEGWFDLPAVGSAGAAAAEGFQGHTYTFQVRAHSSSGLVSSWAEATTQVAATATKAHAWNGLYTLDAYGGIHLADSPPLGGGPAFASPLARAVKSLPGASAPQNGMVLDGYGGLHSYGSPGLGPGEYPYYAGNDIARDFVFLPDGSGGYELDGYGGIHPFSIGANPLPAPAGQYPYFAGNDVAKKITLLSDGSGGYVLDAYGGLHPWSVSGKALPVAIAQYGYWRGLNIARDIWLGPSSTSTSASGYVLDGYGGMHPFWSAAATAPPAMAEYGYWNGNDIARAFFFTPGATAATATGYTLDGYGGIHPFTAPGQSLPPAIGQHAAWPGQDVARALWGA
jgi:spore germination protein YaaH